MKENLRNNMKIVNVIKENLDVVFEDLDVLSKLMDDLIVDLHNVKGGQQARHSYMLYREYIWRIKAELKQGIHSTVTKENE
jgi:hypothetical protein